MFVSLFSLLPSLSFGFQFRSKELTELVQMAARQKKRSRACFESNSNFISTLPSELITNILVKLPIKEAVRTSILSSKWKNLWASIPDLVFKQDSTESGLIRLVDSVLHVHRGPISTFELNCQQVSKEAINRWALILSQNGINLRLCFYDNCIILPSLFACRTLEHLQIMDCSINAPQCFQGFKLLRSLQLCFFTLIGISIENLVSSCPLLEYLQLFDFVEHGCLTIRAPNLRHLDLFGACTDIFLDTPKLIFAKINLYSIAPHRYQNLDLARVGWESSILSKLARLSNIEELVINPEFCVYVASGLVPKELPVTFHRLKKITISLNGKESVDFALRLFRSAPNLRSLSLMLPSRITWEEQKITSISMFKNLKTISILRFEYAESMLGFAKLLLSTAPELEKLVITIDDNFINLEDYLTFLMKLASFGRLSSKAVILYNGNHSTFDEFKSV